MPSILGDILPPIRRTNNSQVCSSTAVSVSPVYLRSTAIPNAASMRKMINPAAVGPHVAQGGVRPLPHQPARGGGATVEPAEILDHRPAALGRLERLGR